MSEVIEGVEPEDETEREGKRLTPAQWEEVCEDWNLARVPNMAALSAKYGISNSALSRGLKKRDAQFGKKKREIEAAAASAALSATIAATASAAAVAAVEEISFASLRKERIEETKTQHYDWITMIGKLTMAELAKAQRAKEPFAVVSANLKALNFATRIISTVRDERYTILEAHDEVDEKSLPKLEILNLTEEDYEKLAARNDDDDGLVVEMPAGIEDVILEGDDGVS